MTTITHAFVSEVADGADATLVRPSNWNEDHEIVETTGSVTTVVTGVGETLETDGPGDRFAGRIVTGPDVVLGSVVIGTPKIPRSNFVIPKNHFYRVTGTLTMGPNIRMTTEENATIETANFNSTSRLYTPGRG